MLYGKKSLFFDIKERPNCSCVCVCVHTRVCCCKDIFTKGCLKFRDQKCKSSERTSGFEFMSMLIHSFACILKGSILKCISPSKIAIVNSNGE